MSAFLEKLRKRAEEINKAETNTIEECGNGRKPVFDSTDKQKKIGVMWDAIKTRGLRVSVRQYDGKKDPDATHTISVTKDSDTRGIIVPEHQLRYTSARASTFLEISDLVREELQEYNADILGDKELQFPEPLESAEHLTEDHGLLVTLVTLINDQLVAEKVA